jgi:acyl carrier protein
MEDIKQAIRHFILAEFLPGESEANLPDDLALRTSGVIDSVGTLKLVTFIEQRFGIEVEPHEAGVEHFDRIADIAALVSSKKGR